MIPEVPIFLDKSSLTLQDLHLYALSEDKTEYYKGGIHIFAVGAVCKKIRLIKEFNGCFSMVVLSVTSSVEQNIIEQWKDKGC